MSKKNRLNDRLMQLHNDQEDFSRQDNSSVIESIKDNIIDLGSDQNDEYEDETDMRTEIIENTDNDFFNKKSKISYKPAQRGIFTTGALPYRCMRNAIYILGNVQTSICNWIRKITIKGILKTTLITMALLLCINRMPSLIYNTFLSGKYNGEELIFDSNYDNAVHTALEKYSDQDFDGDKILNAVDPFPFDRDHDRNGIIDYNDLSIIYTSIKTGKNAVLSLQSERGEALLIIYGFDELGNLYVADYNNPGNMGRITIKPFTTLIKCDDGYITNSFVEAEGIGISGDDMKICLIG